MDSVLYLFEKVISKEMETIFQESPIESRKSLPWVCKRTFLAVVYFKLGSSKLQHMGYLHMFERA